MKDQHGRDVQLSDSDFAVEHGFRKIAPRSQVSDLQAEVKNSNIEVTIYSESLNRQIIPRTSGFTQPIQLTRAANSFQGNI